MTIVLALAVLLQQCGWHELSSARAETAQVEKKVVVLGDSIGAGMAASLQPVRIVDGKILGTIQEDPSQILPGPWPNCPQVTKAWPFLLDKSPKFHVVNKACGGAKIHDVEGDEDSPSQLTEDLADADYVLIVVGANDIGFADGLICMVFRDCTRTDPAMVDLFAKISALRGDLVRLLTKVVQLSPRALVKMVGYPTLFAGQLHPLLCPGIQSPEVSLSLEAQREMVNSTEAAVQEMQAAGGNVGFFNPQLAGPRWIPSNEGTVEAVSDACADAPGRIITSPTNSLDPIQQVIHPNEGGHRWYADLIQEDLELAG